MTVDNLKDKLNGIPAHYTVYVHLKVKGRKHTVMR